MSDSSPQPVDSDARLGLIRRLGWPLTKASYVKAMFSPYDPTFPLDAEVLASVPAGLPGKLPSSEMDLLFPTQPPSDSLPDARQLPEPLVDSAASRHGLSRERAAALLKEFGG